MCLDFKTTSHLEMRGYILRAFQMEYRNFYLCVPHQFSPQEEAVNIEMSPGGELYHSSRL